MSQRILIILPLIMVACQDSQDHSRQMLLELQRNSAFEKEWFVSLMPAIEGLTEDQVQVLDSSENHSIKELTAHLFFWNERILRAFNEMEVSEYEEDNRVTFYSKLGWNELHARTDSLENAWEIALEQAGQDKLVQWENEIMNMCLHRSYHTGQIVYIRKQNDWWKPSDGVR